MVLEDASAGKNEEAAKRRLQNLCNHSDALDA
jgi:hypothetical protein